MFLSGVAVGIIMSIIASTASANSLQCFTKQKPLLTLLVLKVGYYWYSQIPLIRILRGL